MSKPVIEFDHSKGTLNEVLGISTQRHESLKASCVIAFMEGNGSRSLENALSVCETIPEVVQVAMAYSGMVTASRPVSFTATHSQS